MKKVIIAVIALVIFASLLIASPVAAIGPFTIDFESDTTGSKPNGWQSVDSTLVSFTDSDGAGLDIADYGHQSDGKALAVKSDDPSYLIMEFSVPMTSISLDFGNDDPGWSEPGDEAVLTLYYGASQVDQVSVVMNRNDDMDQSISFSGEVFDKATFYYDATIQGGLIEIIDNIHLEPSSLPPPPTSVGGDVFPVNKVGILAPWLALVVILAMGGFFFIVRRQQAS